MPLQEAGKRKHRGGEPGEVEYAGDIGSALDGSYPNPRCVVVAYAVVCTDAKVNRTTWAASKGIQVKRHRSTGRKPLAS